MKWPLPLGLAQLKEATLRLAEEAKVQIALLPATRLRGKTTLEWPAASLAAESDPLSEEDFDEDPFGHGGGLDDENWG